MQKLKILIAKSSEFLKNLGNQHASENQKNQFAGIGVTPEFGENSTLRNLVEYF